MFSSTWIPCSISCDSFQMLLDFIKLALAAVITWLNLTGFFRKLIWGVIKASVAGEIFDLNEGFQSKIKKVGWLHQQTSQPQSFDFWLVLSSWVTCVSSCFRTRPDMLSWVFGGCILLCSSAGRRCDVAASMCFLLMGMEDQFKQRM